MERNRRISYTDEYMGAYIAMRCIVSANEPVPALRPLNKQHENSTDSKGKSLRFAIGCLWRVTGMGGSDGINGTISNDP